MADDILLNQFRALIDSYIDPIGFVWGSKENIHAPRSGASSSEMYDCCLQMKRVGIYHVFLNYRGQHRGSQQPLKSVFHPKREHSIMSLGIGFQDADSDEPLGGNNAFWASTNTLAGALVENSVLIYRGIESLGVKILPGIIPAEKTRVVVERASLTTLDKLFSVPGAALDFDLTSPMSLARATKNLYDVLK